MSSLHVALAASRLGAAGRWRTLRSSTGRFGAWSLLVIGMLVLNGAAGLGDTLRALAQGEPDSTVAIFARSYLVSWVADGFGPAASWVALTVLTLALAGPLFGPPPAALLPEGHAVGLNRVRAAAYVDSVLGVLSAVTTWVALVALTALASLVTLDGEYRARALLLCWGAWVLMVAVSVATAWLRQWAVRAGAVWVKVVVGTGLGVLVGALWRDEAHGADLFGAGPVIAQGLRTAPGPWAATVLLAAIAAALGAGWWACERAGRLPAPAASTKVLAARALPTGAWAALVAVTLRALVRTRVVAVPLVTVAGFATVAAIGLPQSERLIAATVVTTTLLAPLAWSANSLTLTGPGASWMASLPGVGVRQMVVHVALGAAVNLAVSVGPWLVAFGVGRVSGTALGLAAAAAGASTALACALCAVLSVRRAHPAALEDGAALVPAATTVGYTLALLVGPGLAGAWVAAGPSLFAEADLGVGVLAVSWPWAVLAVGVGVLGTALVLGVWSRRAALRSRAYAAVGR